LKSGMSIAAIGGIITSIFTYIYYAYINNEVLVKAKEVAIEQLNNQEPKLDGEGLEMAMKIMDMTTSPFFLATAGLIGGLLLGLIVSLIIGAILKSN